MLSTESPQPILVIEDQALNRKVVRILLQSSGYQVIEAINATEALAALEETVPGLILMDIALPGTSGEELTRQIKTNPDWDSIPIIALTAAVSLVIVKDSSKLDVTIISANPLIPEPS